jgi:hypothetical protein
MEENIMTNLIIFRNILRDDLIESYNNLYKKYLKYNKMDSKEEYLNDYYSLCSFLISRGYDSINDYIADKILIDENIFSLSCEKGYAVSEKIKKAVFRDLTILKKIFEIPLKGMAANACDINNFINFSKNEKLTEVFKNSNIEEIYEYIYEEYRNFGSGQYRNNYAFSINESGEIIPVYNFKPVVMEDIYGYSSQKSRIMENTEKFISGKFALNTLLVGDSGTGKSTTVKALIPMFKNKKLRLIELGKENIHHISNIIETLKDRGMYYIIFIDDLSFESNENSYKYLKSAVEGSIYEQPANILFYVTSNRKHLIKESMLDRQQEIHMRDAINEQTSLADRFGLTILYSEPNQNEYYEIVLGLAKKFGLKYDDEQLLIEAKKFALKNGGRTGRSAVQFIRTL